MEVAVDIPLRQIVRVLLPFPFLLVPAVQAIHQMVPVQALAAIYRFQQMAAIRILSLMVVQAVAVAGPDKEQLHIYLLTVH